MGARPAFGTRTRRIDATPRTNRIGQGKFVLAVFDALLSDVIIRADGVVAKSADFCDDNIVFDRGL
jgi:hypothetical protein